MSADIGATRPKLLAREAVAAVRQRPTKPPARLVAAEKALKYKLLGGISE